jgi:triosephosphate isomerase
MLKFYWYSFSSQMSAESIVSQINDMCERTKHLERMEDIMLFVCVPTASLETVCRSIEDRELVKLCSQCFCAGEISGMPSVEQLAAVGAHAGITGLTDRRFLLGETDEFCRDGLEELLSHGKKGLLCVGETAKMKADGTAKDVIKKQVLTGLSKVPEDAVYRMGIMYRPMWEFEGKGTELDYALEMIQTIKQASMQTLPELPEPLPVFYGGEISPQQLTQLLKKQIIDGVFVDGDKMTSDGFISLIDTVQAAF